MEDDFLAAEAATSITEFGRSVLTMIRLQVLGSIGGYVALVMAVSEWDVLVTSI